ncbi:MAG: hypothetical protein H7X93_10395, partial [Sphingomonadaceae bacterium]|nr:hypothetical protein [Sphingomonadaceae bacterium]
MAVPVEWLGNFQVNTGAAATGTQLDPQIIGLANGNFIVAWTELVGGAIGTSAGQDIIGKIYDRDGNLVRDAFQLNTSNAVDDERDFDIAATSDGGFVMVYIDDDISDVNQTSVIWQRYDASGNSIDSATVANELVAADFLANPNVAVDLTTNTSFVTYTDDVGVNSNVSGVVVSSVGAVGAEFFAAENSADADANADIAVLSDGRIVTVYEETDATTVGGHVRVMNSAGTFLADFEFDNGALGDPKVASLANGGYVVTWTSTNENGNVSYKVYNSSNNVIGSGTQFGSDSTNEAEVVALRDGGCVILWDNDTDGTLEGLRIGASGALDSGPFVIENAPTGVPGISATADGRLLLVWRDTNGGGEIVAKIWDPRGGTVNAGDYDAFDRNFLATDTVTGGAGPTAINSGDIDGAVLLGQAGNDTITGGIGAQTLRGAGGDDSILGGVGAVLGDLIDGGDGFDTLIGSSSNDTVVGGALSDTIDGGDGSDLLTGGLGADSVNGGIGNDTIAILDGEFIDNVDGGAGSDLLDLSNIITTGQGVTIDVGTGVFTGFGGTRTIGAIERVLGTALDDVIKLGDTSNTINGGGGDDSLSGGQIGADDFDGGDGDDTLHGGSGIDTLKGGAGNDLIELLGFEQIDHVDGGANIDTVDYSAMGVAGGPVAVDLGGGTATGFGGTVTVVNVERVIGTDSNDTLDGGGIVGVTLDGGLGDDAINGGIDVQILVGGEGNDTIFADAAFLTTIGDYVEGRDGDDSLIGAGGFDTLLGGALNDTILGGGDSDGLSGEDGKDSLRGEEGQDTLSGGVGADALDGGEGADDLLGDGG